MTEKQQQSASVHINTRNITIRLHTKTDYLMYDSLLAQENKIDLKDSYCKCTATKAVY